MIKMLIQVAAGSSDRKMYRESSLEYVETRHGSHLYPYPYGFIVGTRTADGDCVDCYLITREPVSAGSLVECEPIGLLLQDEAGEVDHKVLAALPGQDVVVGAELFQELQGFIDNMFADTGLEVRVGPLLPREAALRHLEESRSA